MTVWIRGRSAYRLRRSNSARRDKLGLGRGQVRTHAQPSACQEWANERLLAESETVTTSSLKPGMEPLVGVETIAGTAGTAALRYKETAMKSKAGGASDHPRHHEGRLGGSVLPHSVLTSTGGISTEGSLVITD